MPDFSKFKAFADDEIIVAQQIEKSLKPGQPATMYIT